MKRLGNFIIIKHPEDPISLKEENAKEHKTLLNSIESSPEGDDLLLGDDILEVLGGPGGHVN